VRILHLDFDWKKKKLCGDWLCGFQNNTSDLKNKIWLKIFENDIYIYIFNIKITTYLINFGQPRLIGQICDSAYDTIITS
jgi:hypothetical protein